MEARAVPRDLLPLPVFPMPERGRPFLRGTQIFPTAERRRASVRSANEAVWALNFLHGSQFFSAARPSTAQASSLARLEEAALADPPSSPLPDPEASLVEMLGSKASTYAGDDLSCVASYRRDSVSWPASAGSAPLLDVLPDPERFDLAVGGGERLLLSPEDFRGLRECDGVPRPFLDETLRSDESAYFLFVREFVQRKMVTFRAKIRAEAGVFFVSKKTVVFVWRWMLVGATSIGFGPCRFGSLRQLRLLSTQLRTASPGFSLHRTLPIATISSPFPMGWSIGSA